MHPPYFLLKLDEFCVHRVQEAKEQMMRTFIKISISKNRYNLKDNSINHDLSYSWPLTDRIAGRNAPAADEGKFKVKMGAA